MVDAQSDFGQLYFDDFKKLRVLEPEIIQQTSELNDECKDFIEKTEEFRQIAADLIKLSNQLSVEVEEEKIKAIAYRNMMQTLNDDRESKRQQISVLIAEKKSVLERLQAQFSSLKRVEAEQKDLIDHLQTNG
ncbi:Intraflagellar transport protein 20 [Chamberlinius hualienensis]